MDKILERLKLLGERGDAQADELYWAAKDLGKEAFPIWVADNDEALRKVLKFKSVMEDPSDEDNELLKQYTDLRNAGVSAYTGDKKTDVYGRPMKGLDEYMVAFGMSPSNGREFTDKDRSAFTNPENSAYWGNRSDEDRQLAALALGFDDFNEIESDLKRTGDAHQTNRRYEGYDANGDVNLLMWLASGIVGLGAPRVKEAMIAGRDITWQDVAGDMGEMGLSFIPGVGLVGKGGKVIAKIPGAGRLANTTVGSMVGRGVTLGADQLAVPGLTQVMDAELLYNPERLGTPTSELNPRSEYDVQKMLAQAGGIAAAKGTVKATAMGAKNVLEHGFGNKEGGGMFRKGVETFEQIGEKTDEVLARRQAMLDRKAELAKQSKYLPQNGQVSGSTLKSGYQIDIQNPEDIIAADNFRILTERAREMGASRKARTAAEGAQGTVPKPVDANTRDIVMLDDGRFVYADNGNLTTGSLESWTPSGSEVSYLKPKYTPVETGRVKHNGQMTRFIRNETPIYNAIKKDPMLLRLSKGTSAFKEGARDVAANFMFNSMVREGIVGNSSVTELDEKRERAIWNNILGKLRNLTTDPKLSVATRKENADAVMNFMAYGLDGLPTEMFNRNPRIYHTIAEQLGIKNWKHYSEYDVEPTTSYSTSTAFSSSSSN